MGQITDDCQLVLSLQSRAPFIIQSFHHCFVQNAINFNFNVNIIEQ